MTDELSNDILTQDEALQLASAMRESILIGANIHPIDIERLCCYVIKSAKEGS